MPKGWEPKAKRIEEAERSCDEVAKWILRRRMAQKGAKPQMLALLIGRKSGDAFMQKVRHAGRFDVKELRTLIRVLGLTDDEVLEIMKVEV